MKLKALFAALLCLSTIFSYAQEKLPAIKVKDLDGNLVEASSLKNEGPIVVSFWATWCKPCVRELNAINDLIIDWKDETGVKILAISIDDSRQSSRVRPFITSQGWSDYEVYLDENQELGRALNVNNIPHTFLLNADGEIVWQHNGYLPGDEDHLYELITKVANGEEIEE